MRTFAKLLSYIFHPLFIPTYIFGWLLWRFPLAFSGATEHTITLRWISTFWITAFFPALSVFLLWRLKFINSIQLQTQKERILPYIISMIFYWWMWYLSRNFTDQPIVLKPFYLGIFICTSAAMMLNILMKVSMHAMGVASAIVCVLLSTVYYGNILFVDITIVAIIAACVCAARVFLKDHSKSEIYAGLCIAIACQVLAATLSI